MSTSTEDRPLVTIQGGDLAITDDQHSWTSGQLAALRQLGLINASDGDLQVFLHVCKRTGLDPFAKQVYMIYRNDATAPDGRKASIQVGIDGFRLVAQRAARRDHVKYGYEDTLYRTHSGEWQDCWDTSDLHPVAVKVTVLRDGMRFPHVAHWAEYVQTYKGNPSRMWAQMPSNMLAKCAEAGALRKAFSQDLSGIYEPAEMMAGVESPTATTQSVTEALPVTEAVQALYERAVKATGDGAALAALWADARAADLLDEPIIHDGMTGKLGSLVLHLRSQPKPEPTEAKDDVVDADVVVAEEKADPVKAEPPVAAEPPASAALDPLPCGCDPDEVWSHGHRPDCPLTSSMDLT